MEEKALETMGENKASYMMKDAVGKIPASDQEDVKELQKGLGNTLGGSLQVSWWRVRSLIWRLLLMV